MALLVYIYYSTIVRFFSKQQQQIEFRLPVFTVSPLLVPSSPHKVERSEQVEGTRPDELEGNNGRLLKSAGCCLFGLYNDQAEMNNETFQYFTIFLTTGLSHIYTIKVDNNLGVHDEVEYRVIYKGH